MPKVLRIINRFNLGGISYNVSYLSRYMPADYETLLIGGPEEQGEESSLYIPESIGLKPLLIKEMRRSINPINDYYAYKRIKRIIRIFKPDVVHTHASKAGALGRLAAIHCKVPVIVHTFHGHVFKGYFGYFVTGIYKIIERYLARKSSAIVAISDIQKQELSEVYGICKASKITVVRLGFDLFKFKENKIEKRIAFREKYKLKDDELVVGIIGRLAPIKNHFLFIDAIENLSKKSKKKIRAVIVGDGETKEALAQYLKEKNLSFSFGEHETALFIFTSWIKEIDVVLAGIDLVCLSSKNEGTPVSLIEAQAAGKFVVSTNVGGIKDILHPGCGLLSEADDDEGFKNNVLEAVSNFDKYSAKAGTAIEEVIKNFSYYRLCREMDKLYKGLIADGKALR